MPAVHVWFITLRAQILTIYIQSPFSRYARVITHTRVVSAPWRPKNRAEPSRGPKIPSLSLSHAQRHAPAPGRPHTAHTWSLRVALYSRHLGDDTVSRTKTTLTNPTKTNSRVCGEGSQAQSPGSAGWRGGGGGGRRGGKCGNAAQEPCSSGLWKGAGPIHNLAPCKTHEEKSGLATACSQSCWWSWCPSAARDCAGEHRPTTLHSTESGTRTHKRAITQRQVAQHRLGPALGSPPLRIPPPPPQPPSPRAAARRAGPGGGARCRGPGPKGGVHRRES